HRALKDAMLMGLLQRNVTEMVRAPRRRSREMMTLDEDQAKQFLDVVRDGRYGALFVLALTTGMREGELLALRWQDIDLKRRKVQVRMNVQEAAEGSGFIIADTKTASSRRSISLTHAAAVALKKHRIRQQEERLQVGAAWSGTIDLVFPNAWGTV